MYINPKIVEYIEYYTRQGRSIGEVRSFLIANNTPVNEVDEAIAHINQSGKQANQYAQSNNANTNNSIYASSSSTNNIALEMQIKNYIQTQLNSGYNIEVIKGALIRQGINPNIINKVSNDLNNVNINVKHEVHISKGTIIGIVTAIFIIGLVVFGVLNLNILGSKGTLMDVTITNTVYSYLPGETINYQIHITSMGATQRFDAIVKYLVIDDNEKIITRKEETLAVETTASVNRNIQLPADIKPGKYYLRAIAEYDNKQARSTNEFEVVEKAAEKKPSTYVPPQTKDNIVIKPNNKTSTTPTTPSTTTSSKTFGSVLTEVRQTALTDPESAASDCSKLVSVEQKDICYSTIADSTQSISYCDKITGTTYKDNCYLAFGMNGDEKACDKITLSSDKSLCEQLIIIRLMDKYYKENNTEKMLELNQKFNPNIIQNSNPQVQTYEYVYNEPVTIMDIVNDGTTVEELPDETIVDTVAEENVTAENNTTAEENITA